MTHSFKVDGVEIRFEKMTFRQQVLCDGELVSDRRTFAPRWSLTHRFASAKPPHQFEFTAYELDGYLLASDGRIVAERPPSIVLPIISAVAAALGWWLYIRNPNPFRLLLPTLWTLSGVAGLYLSQRWRRDRQRLSGGTVVGSQTL